jgi:hypothetical protein
MDHLLRESVNALISVSHDEWQTLFSLLEKKSLSKNSFFLQEGQICNSIAFVNQGLLIYYKLLGNGKESTTDFAFTGNWVTDNQSRLNGSPSIEAYSQQAHNKDAQDELARWIRFSNVDVKKKKDGLTTSGMEIKGIAGFIVRNFFKPDDAKKETFVEQGIEKARNQANHCGGWLLVTQKNNTPECWIRTGRLIQRINLQCRSLNVGYHPMFQMIEETDFEQSANTTLGFEGYIQFVARVGYVKTYSKPVSMRRSVESFTVFR